MATPLTFNCVQPDLARPDPYDLQLQRHLTAALGVMRKLHNLFRARIALTVADRPRWEGNCAASPWGMW